MQNYVDYNVVQNQDKWARLAAFDHEKWVFKYKKLLCQVDKTIAKTSKSFKYQHENEVQTIDW